MNQVDRLRAMAEALGAMVPDLPATLARDIRIAADGRADPWLLAGVLIEGVAHVIGTMPLERRQDAAAAAMKMLAQRSGLNG